MSDNKQKNVYLDHSSTTPLDKKVFEVMTPYLTDYFANPSAPYSLGKKQKQAVENSRHKIADVLSTTPDAIIFTSGGTESNNLALFGIARKYKDKGKHIISTTVEHPSIHNPLEQLEKEGFEITYLPVDKLGQINIDDLKKSLRDDTILVSVMYANNEIGTIYPIADIAEEISKWRKENGGQFPYFHTDACQAGNTLPLNVESLNIDLMTVNGGKIYGPKGAGILYKRENVEIDPQILGGGQEMGLRSGTENVANIVGMAEALEHAQKERGRNDKEIKSLRDYFWKNLKDKIKDIELNGYDLSDNRRLSNNLHIYFKGIEADSFILSLDNKGIMCTSGSACSSKSLKPSHVLMACGLSEEKAQSSIRFSLGKTNTRADIDYAIEIISETVGSMRKLNI